MADENRSVSPFESAQDYLRTMGVGAWLVYDFRGSNAVWRQLLPDAPVGTRRVFLCIPAHGQPPCWFTTSSELNSSANRWNWSVTRIAR